MKNIIIVAVFCLVASAFAADIQLSDEQKAKVKEHFQACVAQENISEEDAARLRSKDFANPSENMKCFGTCFFEKVGALKDGQLQEDVVLQKLSPLVGEDNAKTSLNKCKDVKAEGRCENGYKIFECFQIAKVELGF
ncbi:hypothetical protein DOY81_013319 [Sarcophaga bullata]|nr:hypothetical protein DOY81_013319 [Sarcophaga bullata]